jgi:biotin synthase
MTQDEILATVSEADKNGVRTIVLQSGENDAEQAEYLAGIIARIKSECDVAVTLCVGVKSPEFYKLWRDAGADRYLLKFETSSPELYFRTHVDPDSQLEKRLSALACLRTLGYQTGSGCIVGLPGQTCRDLADDIILARDLDLDMAAFGPFVPHPNTPLVSSKTGSVALSLRVIAVARLVLGPVHIAAASALDAVAPDGRERALQCGADVIMANLTPDRYRNLYDIYPSNRGANSIERIQTVLARLDRPLAQDHGHSLKKRTEEEASRC